MTREILFRGKSLVNGEWEEGFYVRMHDSKGRVAHRIHSGYTDNIYGNFYSDDLSPEGVEVDPSTVGQYTGRCDKNDKNGKKIFEGDIVLRLGCRYKVFFDEGKWVLVDRFGFWVDLFDDVTYTLIGNIHDNPELLEGEG